MSKQWQGPGGFATGPIQPRTNAQRMTEEGWAGMSDEELADFHNEPEPEPWTGKEEQRASWFKALLRMGRGKKPITHRPLGYTGDMPPGTRAEKKDYIRRLKAEEKLK